MDLIYLITHQKRIKKSWIKTSVLIMCILIVSLTVPRDTYAGNKIHTGLFGLWAYSHWDEGLKLVKDNGFNIVIVEGNKNRVEKIRKQGLMCIVDFKFSKKTTQDAVQWKEYLKGLERTVLQLKDNPAVFAWYPVDEPDGQDIPIVKIQEVMKLIKSLDPNRPIFTVFNTPDKWESYLPYFDIISVDPYMTKRNPATGKPDTIEKVRGWLRKIEGDLRKMKEKKPVWVVLHGFEFIPRVPGIKDWYQIVTPAQFNDMVNIALDENVDGILVYTMAAINNHDYQDWILPVNDPKLWDAVRNLPRKTAEGGKIR
jgi:hypothetical protein